mmetsp:Transcript_7822/g.7392  ORF Transcript_7822/g.7392 Transcript_7822/m.7392 type:complete len:107 (+) Transcript_7822:147-467(+)
MRNSKRDKVFSTTLIDTKKAAQYLILVNGLPGGQKIDFEFTPTYIKFEIRTKTPEIDPKEEISKDQIHQILSYHLEEQTKLYTTIATCFQKGNCMEPEDVLRYSHY